MPANIVIDTPGGAHRVAMDSIAVFNDALRRLPDNASTVKGLNVPSACRPHLTANALSAYIRSGLRADIMPGC
jgi:hypothetical protein